MGSRVTLANAAKLAYYIGLHRVEKESQGTDRVPSNYDESTSQSFVDRIARAAAASGCACERIDIRYHGAFAFPRSVTAFIDQITSTSLRWRW